jgi:hypothetical protein
MAVLVVGVALYLHVSSRIADASGVPAELIEAYEASAASHASNAFAWLALIAFVTLGALIISRQRENRIGWLFCAIGAAFTAEWTSGAYAIASFTVLDTALPGATAAAWVNNWTWVLAYGLLAAVLPLVYPDGHIASPRWRPVAWLAGGALTASTLVAALHTGHLFNFVEPLGIDNPIGVPGLEPEGWATLVPFLALLAAMLAAATSIGVRLRGSTGRARQQLRWFVYYIAVLAVMFVAQFFLFHVLEVSGVAFESLFWLLWAVAFVGLPVATGLAILRHRLFDIDRLINRTLVYGFLSVLMLSVYAVAVLGLGALLGAAGADRESDLAVAGATLAVAALFGPARRRLQAAVDHRFNRSRYDAARTVEALAGRLRNAVKPEGIATDVLDTVRGVVQPSFAALWVPDGQDHHA